MDVPLGDLIMDRVTVQTISVHIKVVAGFPTTITVVAVLILAVDLDNKDTAAEVVFNKEEVTVMVVTIKSVEMLVVVVLDKAEVMATMVDVETMAVLISSKTIIILKILKLSQKMIKAVSITTMPNRMALQSMMASSRTLTIVMHQNLKKIITWITLVSVMIHTDFQ